jgi:hypothetical protein
MKIVTGIPTEKRLDAIKWAFEYFKHVTSKDYFFGIIAQETNWDLSIMLVDDNNELKGLYLFGELQVDSIIKTIEFKGLKGIEGILLAVDKEIQGQGWGNKLKDYPKTLGYDYIWGQQLKSLNNLNDWLKLRYLYAETESVYITIEEFKI